MRWCRDARVTSVRYYASKAIASGDDEGTRAVCDSCFSSARREEENDSETIRRKSPLPSLIFSPYLYFPSYVHMSLFRETPSYILRIIFNS